MLLLPPSVTIHMNNNTQKKRKLTREEKNWNKSAMSRVWARHQTWNISTRFIKPALINEEFIWKLHNVLFIAFNETFSLLIQLNTDEVFNEYRKALCWLWYSPGRRNKTATIFMQIQLAISLALKESLFILPEINHVKINAWAKFLTEKPKIWHSLL